MCATIKFQGKSCTVELDPAFLITGARSTRHVDWK